MCLFRRNDKFVVTVEIDYDPDQIVYQFIYNNQEIQKSGDPYLYGKLLSVHDPSPEPHGQLVCKV